jgi:ribose 5-phosphate isomerase B
MKIVIGADHRGFYMKEQLKEQAIIAHKEIEWIDIGAFDDERTDYPVFAQLACEKIRTQGIGRAVLICGSGGGMAVAANRHKSIYAVVAWDEEIAALAASDDHANVLVIPADFVKHPLCLVEAWLETEFSGDRYQKRIDMIDALGGI